MAGRRLNQCRIAWNAFEDSARILNEVITQINKYPASSNSSDPVAVAWEEMGDAANAMVMASTELWKLLEDRHSERLLTCDVRLSDREAIESPCPICD